MGPNRQEVERSTGQRITPLQLNNSRNPGATVVTNRSLQLYRPRVNEEGRNRGDENPATQSTQNGNRNYYPQTQQAQGRTETSPANNPLFPARQPVRNDRQFTDNNNGRGTYEPNTNPSPIYNRNTEGPIRVNPPLNNNNSNGYNRYYNRSNPVMQNQQRQAAPVYRDERPAQPAISRPPVYRSAPSFNRPSINYNNINTNRGSNNYNSGNIPRRR